MTKAIDIATKLIKLNEGCKLEVYTCSGGKPTFGYGANLEVLSADIVEKIYNLQDKQALEALAVELLEREIINCKKALNTQKWFTDDLTEFQQAIILDLAYNIGVAGVLKFKNMIAAISDHNYGVAGTEMLDSKYHYQMICFGYQEELINEGLINPFFNDYAVKVDIIDWYNSLDKDHKQLRSASNASSLQFNKPLGKYTGVL